MPPETTPASYFYRGEAVYEILDFIDDTNEETCFGSHNSNLAVKVKNLEPVCQNYKYSLRDITSVKTNASNVSIFWGLIFSHTSLISTLEYFMETLYDLHFTDKNINSIFNIHGRNFLHITWTSKKRK